MEQVASQQTKFFFLFQASITKGQAVYQCPRNIFVLVYVAYVTATEFQVSATPQVVSWEGSAAVTCALKALSACT